MSIHETDGDYGETLAAAETAMRAVADRIVNPRGMGDVSDTPKEIYINPGMLISGTVDLIEVIETVPVGATIVIPSDATRKVAESIARRKNRPDLTFG